MPIKYQDKFLAYGRKIVVLIFHPCADSLGRKKEQSATTVCIIVYKYLTKTYFSNLVAKNAIFILWEVTNI